MVGPISLLFGRVTRYPITFCCVVVLYTTGVITRCIMNFGEFICEKMLAFVEGPRTFCYEHGLYFCKVLREKVIFIPRPSEKIIKK